jgi:hypothetical protein
MKPRLRQRRHRLRQRVATLTPLSEETLPVSADMPVVQPAGVMATPTVTELTVDESDGQCSIDYDLDLGGYPDLHHKLGCAVSVGNNDPVGINEFGVGPDYNRFMLWFGSEQQIYVLFPDQTWQSYRDTWDESQPEFSCNPLNAPPSSPPLPRRGFGKLWCSVEMVSRNNWARLSARSGSASTQSSSRFEQGGCWPASRMPRSATSVSSTTAAGIWLTVQ